MTNEKELLIGFKYDYGYGMINGAYVVTDSEHDKIKYLQDVEANLWFDEIFGKESEALVPAHNFYLISDRENDVENFKKMFGRTFGSYKPMDIAIDTYYTYVEDTEEEDDEC